MMTSGVRMEVRQREGEDGLKEIKAGAQRSFPMTYTRWWVELVCHVVKNNKYIELSINLFTWQIYYRENKAGNWMANF